jgi:hypothetical protein
VLPASFELSIEVVLADGTRRPAWSVRGHRRPLRGSASPPPSRLSPVVLNALGRTGSTWLTRLLAQHPEVVVYRPFMYEPRIAGYWLEMLRNLAEPSSFLSPLAPRLESPRWWLEDGEVTTLPPEEDRAFEQTIGGEAVAELAGFCRRRVEHAYLALARQQGKPDSRWFVEKAFGYPGAGDSLRQTWDELYPDTRELLLVRDPRDMVCSMLAYDARRGFVGFGRQFAADDREFLERLRSSWRHNVARDRVLGDRSLMVRYEDLMEQPGDALRGIFTHLSIDASDETVRQVVDQAQVDTPGMRFHRTAEAPGSSVGRWRHDMPEELRELTEEVFAEELADHGYAGAVAGSGA